MFVTGGSGFLGKVLIYKLLVDCSDVASVRVLLREKKGVSPAQRLRDLLQSPPFGDLPPHQLAKVRVLSGDLLLPALGLSEAGSAALITDTNVVFHSAATVKFDEELSLSLKMNVIGTQEMVLSAQIVCGLRLP